MTDTELLAVATAFRAGLLGPRASSRMCFAVCFPLQSLLAMYGAKTELIYGECDDSEHVWLQLSDGRILDPTADQFGLAPVYLGPLPTQFIVIGEEEKGRIEVATTRKSEPSLTSGAK